MAEFGYFPRDYSSVVAKRGGKPSKCFGTCGGGSSSGRSGRTSSTSRPQSTSTGHRPASSRPQQGSRSGLSRSDAMHAASTLYSASKERHSAYPASPVHHTSQPALGHRHSTSSSGSATTRWSTSTAPSTQHHRLQGVASDDIPAKHSATKSAPASTHVSPTRVESHGHDADHSTYAAAGSASLVDDERGGRKGKEKVSIDKSTSSSVSPPGRKISTGAGTSGSKAH